MTYNSIAVANKIIELGLKDEYLVTHLKLQKLIYIAHGWCLATTNKPLIKDSINAWKYGPVIPNLYNKLQHHRGLPITKKIPFIEETLRYKKTDDNIIKLLNPKIEEKDEINEAIITKVWDEYKNFTTAQLSRMTRGKDTPWSKTPITMEIDNELIKAYYEELSKQNN